MKADNTPARKKRQDAATEAKFCRDVAAFKKFVATAIRQLEAGRPIQITATVVKDPCGSGTKLMCLMIKGPPNPPDMQ